MGPPPPPARVHADLGEWLKQPDPVNFCFRPTESNGISFHHVITFLLWPLTQSGSQRWLTMLKNTIKWDGRPDVRT